MCFRTTQTYTDAAIGYIGKCIDDVGPRITVGTFLNQKPWVTGEVYNVIWRSTGRRGTVPGKILAVLRDITNNRAPTPETCGMKPPPQWKKD